MSCYVSTHARFGGSGRKKVYYERRVDGDVKGRYDDYIAQGMNDYEYSLKRKLLWLVYILPVGVILVLVWLSFRG